MEHEEDKSRGLVAFLDPPVLIRLLSCSPPFALIMVVGMGQHVLHLSLAPSPTYPDDFHSHLALMFYLLIIFSCVCMSDSAQLSLNEVRDYLHILLSPTASGAVSCMCSVC